MATTLPAFLQPQYQPTTDPMILARRRESASEWSPDLQTRLFTAANSNFATYPAEQQGIIAANPQNMSYYLNNQYVAPSSTFNGASFGPYGTNTGTPTGTPTATATTTNNNNINSSNNNNINSSNNNNINSSATNTAGNTTLPIIGPLGPTVNTPLPATGTGATTIGGAGTHSITIPPQPVVPQPTVAPQPVVPQPATTTYSAVPQNAAVNAEAYQRTIDPATQTVAGQVKGIIDANSPLMQQANAAGRSYANDRGLVNSSIAAGAAQNAVYNQAVPIGTSDANAYLNAASQNQQAVNAANLQNASAANQVNANNASYANQAAMTNAGAANNLAAQWYQGQVSQSNTAANNAANLAATGYQGQVSQSNTAANNAANLAATGYQGQVSQANTAANNAASLAGQWYQGQVSQANTAANNAANAAIQYYQGQVSLNNTIQQGINATMLSKENAGNQQLVNAASQMGTYVNDYNASIERVMSNGNIDNTVVGADGYTAKERELNLMQHNFMAQMSAVVAHFPELASLWNPAAYHPLPPGAHTPSQGSIAQQWPAGQPLPSDLQNATYDGGIVRGATGIFTWANDKPYDIKTLSDWASNLVVQTTGTTTGGT